MKERRRGTVWVLVVVLVSALSALTLVLHPRMAKGESEPQTPAELSLSWNSQGREEYVWGYLSGFLEGKRAGCSFYADKILPHTPHGSVPPEQLPRQACLNALPDFTEPYFHKYVDTITNYYKKYPNDRQAGMSRILLESASPPGLTIDQIHEKLTR
jgi:hypothetical protein